MLLEAWEGINHSRHVAFSKQKMIIETIPTIQGQDSHFRFAKRCWNQTTVQTFSSWLQHHKNTQKRTIFPVPLIHIQSMARYGFLPSEKDGDNLKLHNRLVDRRGGINITWCSKIIAGKDIENKDGVIIKSHKNILPNVLKDSIYRLVEISAAYEHATNKNATVEMLENSRLTSVFLDTINNAPYLLRSMANELCCIILWYDKYLQENNNVDKNVLNWEVM